MSNSPAPRWPGLLLATVGLALSVVLEVVHVLTYVAPTAQSVCNVGEQFDCTTVAMSRLAVVGGIPLPIWGAAGFIAIVISVWGRYRLLLPLCTVAALTSVGLLLEAVFNVGTLCLYCEGVHLTCVLLLIYAIKIRDGLREPLFSPHVLVRSLAVPLALLLAAKFAMPQYWALSAWLDDVPHATGVDEQGRHWVGAQAPSVTVHEYVDYGCPHCAQAASRMRDRLRHHDSELRVVRHEYARMPCKLSNRGCRYARAAICAGDQGKFWQMDSWLFLHAPGQPDVDLEAATRTLGLDLLALQTCMENPETYERAQAVFKEARKNKIRATPGYIIDGVRIQPDQVSQALQEAL